MLCLTRLNTGGGKPAGGCADINQDVVTGVRGRDPLIAGLLVQRKGPVNIAQTFACNQQAAVGDLCCLHALCTHLLKDLQGGNRRGQLLSKGLQDPESDATRTGTEDTPGML